MIGDRPRTARLLALVLAALLAPGGSSAAEGAGGITVDLELVLAVDVSRSMDDAEYRLQRGGYVAAIQHPDFLRTIAAGRFGRIALAYVEWSSPLDQRIVVPWRLIDGADAARSFAAALGREPPAIGRGTSISAAIAFSAALFDGNGYHSHRLTIDVSGDGPNNYGPPVSAARDAAIARGIVINGLPILVRPSPIVPDVAEYYSACVTGGAGSFVLPVEGIAAFEEAVRRKLVLEVAEAPARIVQVAGQVPVDCLAGEKARERHAPFYPQLDN